jgi:mRNA interferase MazF
MGEISVADIVFVSFPFSDLSRSKLRPALVLAYAQREDWILCQITSKSYNDNNAIRIDEANYVRGSLDFVSYIRCGKLFTANAQIIHKNVASINAEKHQKVIEVIHQILSNGK